MLVKQFVVPPTGIGWPDYTTKITGLPPISGRTIADWQVAEHDIISIGAAGISYWVTLCLLNIRDITPGSLMTFRTYMVVNGVEELMDTATYTQGVDPNIFWAGWVFAIHEVVRITAQSAVAGDNGRAIGYDIMLESR